SCCFFFSSRRRHTRFSRDWSSDVCSSDLKYIYEHKNWTDFSWNDKALNAVFGEVKLMQGKIIGQMNALGFSAKEEATLTALTLRSEERRVGKECRCRWRTNEQAQQTRQVA